MKYALINACGAMDSGQGKGGGCVWQEWHYSRQTLKINKESLLGADLLMLDGL